MQAALAEAQSINAAKDVELRELEGRTNALARAPSADTASCQVSELIAYDVNRPPGMFPAECVHHDFVRHKPRDAVARSI